MSRYKININTKESKNSKKKENSQIIPARSRAIYPIIRNTENRTSENSRRNSYIKSNVTNNINSKMSLIRNKKTETIEYSSSSMQKGGNIKLNTHYKTLEERLNDKMNSKANEIKIELRNTKTEIVSAINSAEQSIVNVINRLVEKFDQYLGVKKNMVNKENTSSKIKANENEVKNENSDKEKNSSELDIVNIRKNGENSSDKGEDSKEIKDKEDAKINEVKSALSSQENKNKKEDVQNSKSSIKINFNKIEHFDSLHSSKKAREKKNVSKNSDSQSSNNGKNGQSNNISQQAFSIGSKDYIYSESFSKTIKENGPVDLAGGSK